MSFVKLPAVALVPHSEVERLRRKFAESQSAAARDQFWMAIQRRKQPRLIAENPDTWITPLDYSELGALW